MNNVTTSPCLLLSLLTWFWLYCVLNCKPSFYLWFEDLTLIIMTTAIEWTLNTKNQVIVHNEPFVFFDICFSCLCVLNTHNLWIWCFVIVVCFPNRLLIPLSSFLIILCIIFSILLCPCVFPFLHLIVSPRFRFPPVFPYFSFTSSAFLIGPRPVRCTDLLISSSL